MNLNRVAYWGYRASLAVGLGLIIATGIVGAFAATLHYVAPAVNVSEPYKIEKPIVENGWLKFPFDILRTKECLAQSTITLRRTHDYGPPLGIREDVVTIGLYNTTVTPTGLSHVMLWFRQPANLDSGVWNYDSKIQDDCGGIGDLFNFSARHPRTTDIPDVLVIPGPS